jgi:hypothetical protein
MPLPGHEPKVRVMTSTKGMNMGEFYRIISKITIECSRVNFG